MEGKNEPWESFEQVFIERQKPLDADIAKLINGDFSKFFLDDADDYTTPKIIKLADLKEVINDIDMGRITLAKGAEILNQVAVEYYKENT